MKILFKNAKVLDLDSTNGYYDGCVLVDENLIAYAGERVPSGDFDKVIDVQGNLLMPGFVNAHAHTPMTLLRGVKDDASLNEWLFEGVLPLEANLTNDDIYWGQMLGMAEYARCGITCFEECYFGYEGICRAVAKAGYRARIGIGPVVETGKDYDCYKDISNIYNLISKTTDKNLVTMASYAHAVYSIDDNKFFDLLKLANEKDLPLSIHVSETLKEVGDCTQKNKGLTPPAYLEQVGYFDRPCLCYHCVHMDKDDLQILADYGASVATCPSSNIKLASGIAPIYAMQNKGINIAIGTDGTASNNSLDMFKEMFLVATLSKVSLYNPSVVSASEVLKMATVNGAKALGVNSGEIKQGKNADLILVKLTEPHMQPCANLVSNLVYSAKGSDVYFTMVGGKVVYNDGEYNIGEDIKEIYKKANEIRNRLENKK